MSTNYLHKYMLKNHEIIQKMLVITGSENPNQLAIFLSEKYGINISRQQINQFQKSERLTITHLFLREALEAHIAAPTSEPK